MSVNYNPNQAIHDFPSIQLSNIEKISLSKGLKFPLQTRKLKLQN